MSEVWMVGAAAPNSIRRHAERLEADGYSGLAVVDSQNLSGDPYVALALAATVTERLGLATGVTNPYTRHPAATASSIATVQSASKGRAVLGIGRGDSALAHLGLSPAPVDLFERYLRRLQGYLRGEDVEFDEDTAVAPVGALGLAHHPVASRIHWIANLPKVPLDVAASGPRVIELAARVADRITFALGADLERLRWGIELARAARTDAGLDPDTLGLGAYVNVAVHPDADVARRLVAGGLSTLARFNVLHGRTSGPLAESDRNVLGTLRDRYDMNHHTEPGSAQASALTTEFAHRHALIGSAAEVLGRFRELQGLGLGKFVVMGAPRAPGLEDEGRLAQAAFASDVLPALTSE